MTSASDAGPRRGGPALEAMYGLTLWLIPTLERFPRRRKFLLGNRIRTTALASLERLTGATFTRRRAPLPGRVNLDLDKLRLLLRLAKDLSYLDRRRCEHAARRFGHGPYRIRRAGAPRRIARPASVAFRPVQAAR